MTQNDSGWDGAEHEKCIRVLMVEDNENDMLIVRDALKNNARYELKWVLDFASARDCLRREAYDVILLDLGLPDFRVWKAFKGSKMLFRIFQLWF